MRALATLHRTLYAEDRLDSLNMASFLKELCDQTLHIAGEESAARITLDVVADDFSMNPDQAVPLALIVTEIVTNSIKYAFPDGRHGTIAVRLTLQGPNVMLSVSDDGIGCLIDPASAADQHGIGLKLIRGFARQLNAEFEKIANTALVTILFFPSTTTKNVYTCFRLSACSCHTKSVVCPVCSRGWRA